MKILIIIPAYNEEKNIELVVQRLKKQCPYVDYLVVNDCSTDNTEKICKQNNYNYISLPLNLGIGGGVQSGYAYAVQNDYDITIQMDGDGQHNPEFIQDIINPLMNNEADMVIGSRFIEMKGFQSSKLRRLGINILKKIIYICCGVHITDATSGFRACNKELTKFFSTNYAQDYPEPEAIVTAIVNGYRIKEVPVVMEERLAGESSINVWKSIYYMVKVSLAIIVCTLSIKRRKVNEY